MFINDLTTLDAANYTPFCRRGGIHEEDKACGNPTGFIFRPGILCDSTNAGLLPVNVI